VGETVAIIIGNSLARNAGGISGWNCPMTIIDNADRINLDVASGDNAIADVNNDGKINILDLIYVRNRLNTRCQDE